MSLEPIEMKSSKRLASIGIGTHLCIIHDIYFLKNAAKSKVLADGKFDIMVVLFKKDGGKECHEQHYVIDGNWRHQLFKDMILAAQVTPKVEGEKPTLKDAKGHRLWISIKGVHHINDGSPVMDEGEPVIEYFIFKVTPYIDNVKKPKIAGDPADNAGVPSGVFVEYNNIAIDHLRKPVEVVFPDKTNSGIIDNKVNSAISYTKVNPEAVNYTGTVTKPDPKIIAEAKEMIKNVQSGVKPEKPVEQPKVIDDTDWDEVPNF